MKTKTVLTRLDCLLICLMALVGVWLAAESVNKPVHPAEDAAMLMRYSQHLARGNGIVWNIGQPPVDGATDFLFMAFLAALYALGGELESSVLWLGGMTHALTVLLVYFGIRRYFKGGVLAALISSVFILFGPGLRYTEASFGTTFFALFCCLSWLTTQTVVEKPCSIPRAFIFAITCLFMGLTRPEGVLIAVFMLLAVIFKLGWKTSKRIILVFLGIFLLFGGAYFLWRWTYFGHPLPNPFYKKGGGSLYPDSLRESWKAVLEISFPFWLVYTGGIICLLWNGLNRFIFQKNWWLVLIKFLRQLTVKEKRAQLVNVARIAGILLLAGFTLGLFRRSSDLHEALVFGRYSAGYAGLLLALLVTGLIGLTAGNWLPVISEKKPQSTTLQTVSLAFPANRLVRETIFTGIPVLGFTLMWILLSNEMNYLWRFQYPILPVILMSWPLLLDAALPALKLPAAETWTVQARGLAVLAAILLGVGLVWNQVERWKITYQSDGRFNVAEYLSQFAAKKYTIATTEAGLLPLYSGWQAVDAWGLNDAWIARNGGITAEYLAKVDPEIIMFHADFSPLNPRTEAGDAWGSMTLTLDTYARDNGYTLAAVYGESPVDTHYYYVRPDFPESAEITAFIQGLDGEYHYGSHTLDYNKLTWKKDLNVR